MRHRPVPIKDVGIVPSYGRRSEINIILQIYSNRTASEARRNQQLPSPEPNVKTPPVIGIQKSAPVQQVQAIPDITPMRRGRPTAPQQVIPATKANSSPMRGTASDPFAALDSNNLATRSAAVDELSAKFPSLDEFSILHDKGTKFQFSSASPEIKQDEFSKRVTQALADDAFAQPLPKKAKEIMETKPASAPPAKPSPEKKPAPISKEPTRRSQPSLIHQPTPQRPSMVSTGIQTSPPPSPKPEVSNYPDISKRPPVWRVPSESAKHHFRALSQPRAFSGSRKDTPTLKPEAVVSSRPSLLDRALSSGTTLTIPKSPASSRPSLEGSRPSVLDLSDSISRSKSANARPRPTSIHVESNLDYLRHRESNDLGDRSKVGDAAESSSDDEPETVEKNIRSNVEFLRSMEGDEKLSKKEKRRSSSGTKSSKRSSLPSISLSGTKNILAGKFGDAFKRFESNSSNPEPPRTPSPTYDRIRPGVDLTPIAGSEATDDHESAIDESQELPPEIRRELERRRLSEEEKRVAEAAAEYRKRLAEGGKGKPSGGSSAGGTTGPTRASTIQNRVKSLLEDTNKVAATRTAEGYGKYTDMPSNDQKKPYNMTGVNNAPRQMPPPSVARKPIGAAGTGGRLPVPPKPAAKPAALRTGGVAKPGTVGVNPGPGGNEDWEADFSKRYPSLSLEMVETEIQKGPVPTVRDV